MATKWKNFPDWFYHGLCKTVAVVLTVVCTGSVLISGAYLYTNSSFVSLTEESYLRSKRRMTELSTVASSANELLKQYRSEEFVRSGGTVNMRQLQQELLAQYDDGENAVTSEEERRILTEHAAELEERKQQRIVDDLQDYFALVEFLNESEGVYYYATDGQTVVGNVPEANKVFFEQQPAYLLFDCGKTEHDAQTNKKVGGWATSMLQDKIYVAFSPEYVAQREAEFRQSQDMLNRFLIWMMALAVADLCAGLYLLFATGRKPRQTEIQLCPVDHLYTDVAIGLGALIAVPTVVAECGIAECFASGQTVLAQENPFVTGLSAMVYGGVAAELAILLSLVRQWKAKQLISHSLAAAILRTMRNAARKLRQKILQWIHKGPILLISSQQLSTVRQGVQEVKEGNLSCRIDLPREKALFGLAQDINAMSDGLQKAVEQEVKAERLKTELITNVSHDLKTPLTSIINYSDLLTKEALMPDYANDYVRILKEKSEKLKQLTNDLFEISKVQSGNIKVNTETLQVKELIAQAVAEYEDKLKAADLQMRVTMVPDDWYIVSDGKKIARVLDNLLGNILKYAQPRTRVYAEAAKRDGMCEITLKNIANYEMNFHAEEIVQRFARGEASRTTEGNGLGLAIARSYTEACGGKFHVETDGDLFKATLTFPLKELK